MAVINASQELGDYANIVAKAQIPTENFPVLTRFGPN